MVELAYVLVFVAMLCAGGAAVALRPAGPPLPRLAETRPQQIGTPLLGVIGRWCARWIRLPVMAHAHPSGTARYLTAEQWMGMKVVAAVFGIVMGAVLMHEFQLLNPISGGLLGGVAGLLAPGLWLKTRQARRQRAIIRLLPEVIDLIVLCVEAGMDFMVSLQKVVALKQFQGQPLIEEFSGALQEMKLGRRKAEALREMAQRVNVSELTSFIRAIVITDRMGTSMAEVLGTHSEDVRFQRRIRAERMALKAPVKLLIPLIFCIMPCVAILVGGPILLQFTSQSPFGK